MCMHVGVVDAQVLGDYVKQIGEITEINYLARLNNRVNALKHTLYLTLLSTICICEAFGGPSSCMHALSFCPEVNPTLFRS